MTHNYQYLIIGLLIYAGIVGVFLLILGFNRREEHLRLSEEDQALPISRKDSPQTHRDC